MYMSFSGIDIDDAGDISSEHRCDSFSRIDVQLFGQEIATGECEVRFCSKRFVANVDIACKSAQAAATIIEQNAIRIRCRDIDVAIYRSDRAIVDYIVRLKI